ncbi:SUMO-targeted ubiquitin ligase complex subunit slx8 [Aspergillus hancockii]|nr:SUMO-targeted ubiquitin ligase complex subunit slx8 [Aspergillus hancockii]
MDRSSPMRGRPPAGLTSVHITSLSPPRRRRPSDHGQPLDSRSEERKRRRLSNTEMVTVGARPTSDQQGEDDIESIDLTEVEGSSALSKVLAKQREDAVRAQQPTEHEKGRSILNSYKCPVCMDTPGDATSTGTYSAISVLLIRSSLAKNKDRMLLPKVPEEPAPCVENLLRGLMSQALKGILYP